MIQNGGIRIKGHATIDGADLFSNLDLHIPAGQWTCLLGGSGVGKSTVLRLIAGLDCAVEFTGQISTTDGAEFNAKTTFMAQDDLLLPWATVLENVTLGARLRGDKPDLARALDMLARVALSDHAHKKPRELSGGQRQRVALARTLMEECSYLLLDEPFSALDAKTRAEMQELAYELFENKTILLVTHDPAEAARLSHHAYIMEPSGLVDVALPTSEIPRGVDDPETLKAQGAMFRTLRYGAT